MRKFLFSGVLLLIAATAAISAPIIQQPSKTFITALKTCSKTDFYEHKDNMIYLYKINGINSDNKCEISLASYEDYGKKEVYDDVVKFVKAFGGDNVSEADIPTPEKMLEDAKRENLPLVCNLTMKQRSALVKAYFEEDSRSGFWGKLFPRKTYKQLMMSYYPNTCNYMPAED